MFEIRTINNIISLALLDLEAFAKSQNLQTKREIEKAGTFFLLKKLMNEESIELSYSETKKPFLKNRSEHISISHSHAKLAIIMNRQESTGVDIELIRDKVKTIQDKFLNQKEIAFANGNSETLVTLWAAKETLYKIYGRKKMEFKKHLFVEPFNSSSIVGRIEMKDFRKRYELVKEKVENYVLVYALNNVDKFPYLNFPDSNEGTVVVKNFTVHKKFIGYFLVAELEREIEFYNHKSKTYQHKNKVRIEGRSIYAFFKFYKRKHSEVHIISIEDGIILDIAEMDI